MASPAVFGWALRSFAQQRWLGAADLQRVSTRIHSSHLAFGAVPVQTWRMQPMQGIVDVYVRHGNREALDRLLAHRGKLLTDLRRVMISPYDVSGAMAEIEDDIAVIKDGLARVISAAAA
jgi:hypothetical protein